MTASSTPTPTAKALREYAQARGWITLPQGEPDRLHVLSNPRFPRRQLVWPMDATAPDYEEGILLAASKLADIQGMTITDLLRAIKAGGKSSADGPLVKIGFQLSPAALAAWRQLPNKREWLEGMLLAHPNKSAVKKNRKIVC